MKANKDKCQLIVEYVSVKFVNSWETSSCEMLLGIDINMKLNYKKDLYWMIKKTSQKICGFFLIPVYMNIFKGSLLIEFHVYITTQLLFFSLDLTSS